MTAPTIFALPDTITGLQPGVVEFSPQARPEAERVLARDPGEVFGYLVREQESDTAFLVARRVVHAFLQDGGGSLAAGLPPEDAGAAALLGEVRRTREELAPVLSSLRAAEPDPREAVLRQRAPLALIAGCWLDTLSQPATQPSVVVNRLFAQHFLQQGEGNPQRSLSQRRRRVLEDEGIHLPEIAAPGFLRAADARPLTALHAAFWLSLSLVPASFLPEVVGVHVAYHALGVDDALAGTRPLLPAPALEDTLEEYVALTRQSPRGALERLRLAAAVEATLALESEHVRMLSDLAEWRHGLSLEARVAAIVDRHRRYAGRQHGRLRVAGKPLSDTLSDPDLDLAQFVREFRESPYLRPTRSGPCRFVQAMKFGGPMFGIFDEREAATLQEWVAAVQAGEAPEVVVPANRAGDEQARARAEAVRHSDVPGAIFVGYEGGSDRELLYRLVHVERFPNTLEAARQRALRGLEDSEILFTHGAGGRYTDATWFDYTPEALLERVERVYWDKGVEPYEPLRQIPSREDVLFGQKVAALGALVDGAWAYRIGNVGRFRRRSDGMLFAIYADEMGRGDLRKNHITIIHQVLASMDIRLPHIRDAAFVDQEELPDGPYPAVLHQLCLALHPDSLYNEILGYNLGIECFGLGQVRLQEAQKLRHHGFDDAYERIHQSIDNVSAGHARQSAEIIVSYLDDVRRNVGDQAVPGEWRRIWRGYASFAYFVETRLVQQLRARERAAGGGEPERVDVII